jgi:PLP dependent protein
MMENEAARLADVEQRIARAAGMAGRPVDAITLIAVSKTQSVAAIAPLIAAGVTDFGENRVQEAEEKWPALISAHPQLRLHMIGQLQSNKAEAAVRMAHAIHSVDRPSLVAALARAMDKAGRRPEFFIQVNLEGAAQKGGCPPEDLAALLAAARVADLPVIGLMTVPPQGLEPSPWFALLAKLACDHGLAGLSMGMSGDYEAAVKLGATHVRVGSALFGARG